MNRRLFIVILLALFCLANLARAAYRGRVAESRFAAEGAAHFRYTQMVARGEPIPALDRPAQWPEGFRVFREASPAMEYLFGGAWRLVRGTKIELASFIRIATAFVFSLALFPLAFLSARFWKSRGAGVLTAAVVAVAPALVARSSGFEYIRENVTFPLIVYHACFYLAACASSGVAFAALSGVFLFAALASWHGAQFYLVPFLLFVLVRFVCAKPEKGERRAAGALVCAIIAAGIAVPYLREGRFLLSITAALAAAVIAVDLGAPAILSRALVRAGKGGGRGAVNPDVLRGLLAGAVIAAVILPGALSGRHFASYSHFFDLVIYKLRYFQKPDDPLLLPFDARAFWVGPFDSPDPRHLFVFVLPVILAIAGALPILARKARGGDVGARIMLSALAASLCLALLMQRLEPLFGFVAAAVAGGTVPAVLARGRPRGISRPGFLLSLVAVAIFVSQDFAWEGRGDYWRSAARRLRVPSRRAFVIFPFARDVEGDLLAWIRDNTDPAAVVMSLHYLSPQVLTYAGRATNLNDFFESPLVRRKAERLLTLLYADEEDLYRFCAAEKSDYLLLSCAVGCDPTKESPLYQAGLVRLPPGCAAYRLSFEPETLSRFDLVYENEMYRLFRVGRPASTRLWPRSPLFYEGELLRSVNGDRTAFYAAARRVYALTDRGRSMISRGAERQGTDDLLAALRVCYFYPAWKTLDGVYERGARTAEREAAAAFAYRYDPNRADVCLALAESRLALGKTEDVREILGRCATLPATAAERRAAAALLGRLEAGSPARIKGS